MSTCAATLRPFEMRRRDFGLPTCMFKRKRFHRKQVELPDVTPIDPLNLPDGPIAVIDPASIERGTVPDFGPAPEVPEGPLSDQLLADVEFLYGQPITGDLTIDQFIALEDIGDSGDPRLAWVISDHLRVSLALARNESLPRRRFFDINERLSQAAFALTGLGSLALSLIHI